MKNAIVVLLVGLVGFVMYSAMKRRSEANATLPVHQQFLYPPNRQFVPSVEDQLKVKMGNLIASQGIGAVSAGVDWLSGKLVGGAIPEYSADRLNHGLTGL